MRALTQEKLLAGDGSGQCGTHSRGGNSVAMEAIGGGRESRLPPPSLSCSLACSSAWQMPVELLLGQALCWAWGLSPKELQVALSCWPLAGGADGINKAGGGPRRWEHHQRAEDRGWASGSQLQRTRPTLSHGQFPHPRRPICIFVVVVFISGFVFPSLSHQRASGKIPPLFQLDQEKGGIVHSFSQDSHGGPEAWSAQVWGCRAGRRGAWGDPGPGRGTSRTCSGLRGLCAPLLSPQVLPKLPCPLF